MRHLILFDGVCGLCQGLVQFVLKHDTHERFAFAALQSDGAQKVLQTHSLQALDTVVVVENYRQAHERIWTRSQAALFICGQLGGVWKLTAVFYWVPNRLRNWVYDFVAAHRYRWFGKTETCRVFPHESSHRFLE